jgi:succinoglycan biosynthesis protein ExoA
LSLKSRIALAIALPTMHLSWGVGFVKGFLTGAGTTIDKGRLSGKAAGK